MDELGAWVLLEDFRWGRTGVYCPHCASQRVTFVTPRNGRSRMLRSGTVSYRRLWRCMACTRQFSVLTGTAVHNAAPGALEKIVAILAIEQAGLQIANKELADRLGISARFAWRIRHALREGLPLERQPDAGRIGHYSTWRPARLETVGRGRRRAAETEWDDPTGDEALDGGCA